MRIVIDLQGAQTESRFRGIGRYSLSLAKAMIRNRGDHEIIVALSGLFPNSIEPIRSVFAGILPQENIKVWYTPGPVNGPGNTWRGKAAELIREAFIADLQPDIVHISSMFEGFSEAVVSIGCFDHTTPVSVSHYDLIPLLNPDQYLAHNPIFKQFYLQQIDYLEHASLLLAISEFSQQEAMETFDKFAMPIVNASTAADAIFQPLMLSKIQAQAIYEKFGISRPFVFYAGGTDGRKNIPRLIRAYGQLSTDLRKAHQLVIAGKISKEDNRSLSREAKSAGLRTDELVFTGYTTDEELAKLYNLCVLYVFPSWHEGFGLPALEAMSCGAAVIGSNTTSLPEVIGNLDAMFDPLSEQSIADKITQVLSNADFRECLIKRGLEQSRHFSWDKSAKVAINSFEKILKAKKSLIKTKYHNTSLIKELAKISAADQPTELDIVETAKSIALNNKTVRNRKSLEGLTWRVEGPFDSSYSLALLNRETAIALELQGHNVALHSTEGPGDFDPAPAYLEQNRIIKKLHSKSYEITSSSADIISRNLYPPRVDDMQSQIKLLHHYAWEESGFPQEWAQNFNSHLTGMTCLSRHVQKVMIDNGVSIPMQVSGCGVDHWERVVASNTYSIEAKQFKFLHVSSCFPRKGVDCLLQAYGKKFKAEDDVSLIIKTFPNPHNQIHQWLEDARQNSPSYPHVVIIEDDIDDSELRALYESCEVLVAPSRAEGFGLPMAEAMLSGIPVITTAWSGQLDFCNPDNSWLVDFEFEKARTHFGLFLSAWAEPNIESLANAMVDAHGSTQELRASKAKAGRDLLLRNFKWTDVVQRYVNSVGDILEAKISHHPKIAWLSTWNIKCGIATYSEHLISDLPNDDVIIFAPKSDCIIVEDEINCVRNWTVGKERNGLNQVTKEILTRSLNTIVIQFNYGFYNHLELSQFIDENEALGHNIIVVFHSTVDPDFMDETNLKLEYMASSLKRCHRLLVHSVADLNRLKSIGLVENVALFPHGVMNYDKQITQLKKSELPLLASYGFCLPNKGLEELVDAVAILKERGSPVRLRLVNAINPAPISATLVKNLKTQIKRQKIEDLVEFNYQYLEDSESLELLSDADLIVFPYQQTGESSSASVRYGLATKCPVAVTPLSIFDDISNAAFRLSGTDSTSIALGITEIIRSLSLNSKEARDIRDEADDWRKEFAYEAVSQRLYGICSALLQQK